MLVPKAESKLSRKDGRLLESEELIRLDRVTLWEVSSSSWCTFKMAVIVNRCDGECLACHQTHR